ncbi:flavoprotein [Streptomyces sp. WAC 01529]|uniref:flavoprotein n=1 Tax=Streptomyces sp. WAC 01529 TaxID=2203205 RepID=UPI000F71D02B|nr:flavoprotein [Streptomyces sp. WAC 01529]AZM57330.1 flavoprotein [Streptomyces sp. WAC 01529]
MTTNPTLYLIACAAPPARRLEVPIRAAQRVGWDVCLILTPSAHRWLTEDAEGEIQSLEELTGHPVRWQYKLPSQPDVLPPPDAILVAPLTNNTLAKWATAVSDTLALGLITEGIGLGLKIVALPHFNDAQAAHPAVARHVDFLREAGVTVLLGDGGFTPHKPKQGNIDAFPWQAGLNALYTEG